MLTAADHAALRQHRHELLALIRPEATPPEDTCLGCGTTASWWCPDWAAPGEGRSLCKTCIDAARREPRPSLAEAGARLFADERCQLEAEAAEPLAPVTVDPLAEDSTIPPGVAADMATTIAAALRDAGWIVVYSASVNCDVIFTSDANVAIPDEYAALPRFDLAELALLAAQRPSAELLRGIIDTKRIMPGSRVVRDTDGRTVGPREVFPISTTNTESTTTATEAVQGELEARAGRREA